MKLRFVVNFVGAFCMLMSALGQRPPSLDEEMRVVLELLQRTPAERDQAQAALAALPQDRVVEWAVAALHEWSLKGEDSKRVLGYWVLVAAKGAELDAGFDQLMLGLGDPRVNTLSMQGLLAAPPEKHAAIMEKVGVLLTNSTASPEIREGIVRELGQFGTAARPCLEQLFMLLADPGREERLRSLAAEAVLEIGGLNESISYFGDLDKVGQRVAVRALTKYVDKRVNYGDGLNENDAEHRAEALDFVLRAMRSPDVETRKAASGALWTVAGPDLYVTIRSRENYEMNPKIQEALEDAAARESDDELREFWNSRLDPVSLGRTVQGILRDRERPKSRRGAPGP